MIDPLDVQLLGGVVVTCQIMTFDDRSVDDQRGYLIDAVTIDHDLGRRIEPSTAITLISHQLQVVEGDYASFVRVLTRWVNECVAVDLRITENDEYGIDYRFISYDTVTLRVVRSDHAK